MNMLCAVISELASYWVGARKRWLCLRYGHDFMPMSEPWCSRCGPFWRWRD